MMEPTTASRLRTLRTAIIAMAVLLALTASYLVFLVLSRDASVAPPAPAPRRPLSTSALVGDCVSGYLTFDVFPGDSDYRNLIHRKRPGRRSGVAVPLVLTHPRSFVAAPPHALCDFPQQNQQWSPASHSCVVH